MVAHLAAQIGVSVGVLVDYTWAGRTGRRHRLVTLDHLALVACDEAAEANFRGWLAGDGLPRDLAGTYETCARVA